MKKFVLLLFFALSINVFSQETIESKFAIPDGFEREIVSDYHKWVISQPLKEDNKVFEYDGAEKPNDDIWAAVFDYDIGNKDLHQCADASIYLNAMYKYEKGYKDQLTYSFTSGDKTFYKEWLSGVYYVSDPNNENALQKRFGSAREDNIGTFKKWLELVWTYAGTWSVENLDTKQVDIMDMKPGDIFVQGGFPGHAISVVDIIINKETGNKKYMLAQSYMPAQEQHVLLNQETGDVWYDLNEDDIITPEWPPFASTDLKRFK